MILKVSGEVKRLIFVKIEDVVVSLAAVSVISFQGIPRCEGTYMKHIELFISYINFCICVTNSFLE